MSFHRHLHELQQFDHRSSNLSFEGSDAALSSNTSSLLLQPNMVLQTGSPLNSATAEAAEAARKLSDRQEDDGLGSSDDDTISSASHDEVMTNPEHAAFSVDHEAREDPNASDNHKSLGVNEAAQDDHEPIDNQDGINDHEDRAFKAPLSREVSCDSESVNGHTDSEAQVSPDAAQVTKVSFRAESPVRTKITPLIPETSPASSDDTEEDRFSLTSLMTPEQQVQRRKVILPDQSAIKHLLAFDEEEEDDFEEEEPDEEEEESKKSSPTGWHKTIVKDLLSPTHPSQSSQPSSSSSGGLGGIGLQRRHSISICDSQSKKRRNTPPSTTSSLATSASSSALPSCPKVPSYQLDVSRMQENLEEELESKKSEALQTLDLQLEEVAHIRSVLTKAELADLPIDGSVRQDVEKGKVCFICKKTKFGFLFSRGFKCQMCKQQVCGRCQSKMNIPLEHFTNTPVFALRPMSAASHNNNNNSISLNSYSTTDATSNNNHPILKEKKVSLPDCLGILDHKSVGSAPNSPRLGKRSDDDADSNGLEWSAVPTISGSVGINVTPAAAFCGPTSLPPMAYQKSKYATLPTKNRRLSSVIAPSFRDAERQKLEGSPLTVCTDCRDMVVQVIRVSGTTRKMQMVRSVFAGSSQSGHKSP